MTVCQSLLAVAIGVHLTEAFGIGRAYKIGLHIVDAALRIHQVLTIFSLNLDQSHHDTVNHVHRIALFFTLLFVIIPVNLSRISIFAAVQTLSILVEIILNFLCVIVRDLFKIDWLLIIIWQSLINRLLF